MLSSIRQWIRSDPSGNVIFRGSEVTVFQRNGYQGFVFRKSPNLIQGWQSLEDPLDFRAEFVEMQLAATMCVPRPRRVAVLGLGLGTTARTLQRLYPPVEIHAVESNKEVIEMASRFFGLELTDSFRVYFNDAFDWIRRAQTDAYDAVYVDLYGTEGLVPFLEHPEFVQNLGRILRPKGLFSFNLIRNRKSNVQIGHSLSALSRSVWKIDGVRKSNVALFGIQNSRVDPLLSLERAKRYDRLDVLPFRLNRHVRRMERLFPDSVF